MTPASTISAATREPDAFLQERVAGFGLVTASISLAFLGVRIVAPPLFGWSFENVGTSHALHAAAILIFAGVWLFLRTGTRPRRVVRAVEIGGLLGGSGCFVAMAMVHPIAARPELLALPALTFGFIARAVYVPSTGAMTCALGVVIGIPHVLITYAGHLDTDPERFAFLGTPAETQEGLALWFAVVTTVWWSLIVAVCTQASRVIFGLRSAIRVERRLGQYTLEEKLAEGGMGTVYRASHAMLRRPTAVKLCTPSSDDLGDTLARFEREAQLTARLTHPSTIRVYDYGRTPDGIFYYAMELLDGVTLREVVKTEGPMCEPRVIRILDEVCGSLIEAHGIGLIHRDIKPSNIMITRQPGTAELTKVLDFGLVREVEGKQGESWAKVAGTPRYLAPEAILTPGKIDARADLYSLGAVGYFLLTGEPLFAGVSSIGDAMQKQIHEVPLRPSECRGKPVHPELEAIVLACLSKDPRQRPEDAEELRARLRAIRGIDRWTDTDAERWWKWFDGEGIVATRGTEPESTTFEIDRSRERNAAASTLCDP